MFESKFLDRFVCGGYVLHVVRLDSSLCRVCVFVFFTLWSPDFVSLFAASVVIHDLYYAAVIVISSSVCVSVVPMYKLVSVVVCIL